MNCDASERGRRQSPRRSPRPRCRLSQSTSQSTLTILWRQLFPMSSYYREHVAYPNVTAGPYPSHLAAQVASTSTHNAAAGDHESRPCSVKGCDNSLPSNYAHKMCDVCRGRHRKYAMTKRAKRKLEKAALNGTASGDQTVAWMPLDEAVHGEPSGYEQYAQPQQEQPVEPTPDGLRTYEVMHPSLLLLCRRDTRRQCGQRAV